jgi:hypothetical protein
MSSISLVIAPRALMPPPLDGIRGRSAIMAVADDRDDCQSLIRSACQSSNWRSGLVISRVEWRRVDDDPARVTGGGGPNAEAGGEMDDASNSSRGNAVGENLVMVLGY